MEIVTSIPGKIAECLFDATGRQLGYLLHYNGNIEALRKQAKKLADARDDVQAEIDVAKRNGEIIKADVQNWISEVDNLTAAAEEFLDDEVKANKKCLGGWCMNLRTRYKFCKEAQKKTREMSQLQEEGKFKNVSLPAPPPEIIPSSQGIFEAYESRKSIMKQIMEALKDEKVSIIGVCGMGGVGKTTLVKEIGKQVKQKKLFDEAVMVTVSQNPILTKIQEGLAIRLGLTLPGNDQSARASSLWNRIQAQKQILVILDDIWERIDLVEVGIPFGADHKGCKILLTSRSQGVCEQMDAQKIVTLKTLSKEESWVLFREAAGHVIDNSDINPTAREVVAECGGLPIAILTVGRALRNKNKYVWDAAVLQLKRSTPTKIDGMQKHVISSLELSYNYLESEETKSLFLSCCLFPEDHNIEIELLLRYGMGLRWFKNIDTVEEARLETHAIVSSLISSFLLIVGDEERYVKMHDVVRDVALTIASKNNNTPMAKAGIGLKVWPNLDSYEHLTSMSLMMNDICEIPDGLNCPKLQTLLLQKNNYSSFAIPDLFFSGLTNLKVLDLSDNCLSLPSSIALLVNLRTLRLENCLLDNLSSIKYLEKLEILSLAGSILDAIPSLFSQLCHLRLLDLQNCQYLRSIPQDVISRLEKLEELYLGNSFNSWDYKTNVRWIELQALSRLTNLVIELRKPIHLPNLKPFDNLNQFTILLGSRRHDFNKATSFNEKIYSRKMWLSYSMKFGQLPNWVKFLLKKSEALRLYAINGIEEVQGDLLDKEGFTELKFLDLQQSNGVKYLLNTLKRALGRGTFINLEVLKIWNNPNFVEICHGQALPAESFSKLKQLSVDKCGNILNIAPAHLLQRLQNLERCAVSDCESLICVFDLQGLETAKEETNFLSSLVTIYLSNLPKIIHIWKGARFVQSISLASVVHVDIYGCHKLENIFTTSIAKSLVLLEQLIVSRCSGMKEIVINQVAEEGASAEMIVFPNLYSMDLICLDSLTCFYSGQYPTEFLALEKIAITSCPKMKTFGNGDQKTPKLKKVFLQYENRWNGDLNRTVKQFSNEQEMIQKEEEMKEGGLPENADAQN